MTGRNGWRKRGNCRKGWTLSTIGLLSLIPLCLFLISSPGCGKEEVGDPKAEKDALAALTEELQEVAADLSEKETSLRNWEADLRAKQDRLEQQERAVAKKLQELDEKIEKAAELEAATKRGPTPSVYGKRAIVIDAKTGNVLYEKNADEPCAVASTQKLMTALLVAEKGDLDQLVTVDDADTKVEPTKIYIKPGEKIPRSTILTGLLVRSGNDLALCLARDHSGSVEEFAKNMNRKAEELGMEKSNFVNPHGLTETGQQSTARDMAKLARAAYQNKSIREIICQKTYTFEHEDGTKKPLTNTNRVLRGYDNCNGMKTGYTRASGYCLICSGEDGDRSRIVVVLGSTGSYVWNDAEALLKWALKG